MRLLLHWWQLLPPAESLESADDEAVRVLAAVSFFLKSEDEPAAESEAPTLALRLNCVSSLVRPLPPVLLRRTCRVEEWGCSSDVRGDWLGACGVCSTDSDSDDDWLGAAAGEEKKAECS